MWRDDNLQLGTNAYLHLLFNALHPLGLRLRTNQYSVKGHRTPTLPDLEP